jgi:hypothetical protein
LSARVPAKPRLAYRRTALTPGAERQRRRRQRAAAGTMCVAVEFDVRRTLHIEAQMVVAGGAPASGL